MRADLPAARKIGLAGLSGGRGARQADWSMGDNATKNSGYDLIEELEDAVARKGMRERAEMFRRVADLFALGSAGFAPEQVHLFDDVMGRLVGEVDVSTRAETSRRLAGIANAPQMIIRTLALDPSIDVAGPVLSLSMQVDEETLIISAKTRGQAHLLAISRRRTLSEAVTDILVERGDREVTISVAANHGARFSETSYATLVKRSENDEELAVQIWLRPEVPRQHLLTLLAAASGAVLNRLAAADHRKADLFNDMVAHARNQIESQARLRSPAYLAARSRLEALKEAGKLDRENLFEFARSRKFDETTIALSLLNDLPVGLIERAIAQDRCEQVLVLGRATGLDWRITREILQMQAASGCKYDLEQCYESFAKLQPETAKKALMFYRLREEAAMAPTRQHRAGATR
jgi:uncharacterized protein (DUF2336 family)